MDKRGAKAERVYPGPTRGYRATEALQDNLIVS